MVRCSCLYAADEEFPSTSWCIYGLSPFSALCTFLIRSLCVFQLHGTRPEILGPQLQWTWRGPLRRSATPQVTGLAKLAQVRSPLRCMSQLMLASRKIEAWMTNDRPDLSSERAPPNDKTVTFQKKKYLWSKVPDRARHQDVLTDLLSVAK
jgi:hypothetical protein